MTKYSIELTSVVISITKGEIKNLETFVTSKINKELKSAHVDLVQPVVLKETEYTLVNDRLLITALVTVHDEVSDSDLENLKLKVTSSIKEYLNNQSIIYKTILVSLFKL